MPTFDARVTSNDHNVESYFLSNMGVKPRLAQPLIMGHSAAPKSTVRDRAIAGRFNIDVPLGANIRSVNFGITTFSSQDWSTSFNILWRMGWLARDGVWDVGNSFDDYTQNRDFPHVRLWDPSLVQDNSVFQDGTQLQLFQAAGPVFVINTEYNWGENNSPDFVVAGMAQQLENYITDNEAARIGGLLPVAFYISSSQTTFNVFEIGAKNFTSAPTEAMHLVIEWDPPGEAELASTATIDAVAAMVGNFRSELSAEATVDVTATLIGNLLAELSSNATLDAVATLNIKASVELLSSATLDALGSVVSIGGVDFDVELTSSVRLDANLTPAVIMSQALSPQVVLDVGLEEAVSSESELKSAVTLDFDLG